MNLARGAARGAAWNFATVLAERSFGFLILGLLLRVIPASVVGLIAIGTALADLARVVANSGAGEQVQANPGDTNVEAGAFWSQLLASLVFLVVLIIAAPFIARLYHLPGLVIILDVMAFNVVMNAFLVVPSARLTTAFRFRAIGLMSLSATVCGGLVALPFAYTGHGITALICQRLTGTSVYAVAACIVARWTPPRLPPLPVLRESFRFSWPLMEAGFVDYIAVTGYVMLVGLRMPVAALGEFRIAQRLVEVLQEIAFLPARKVFLPVFVAVRHNLDRRFETTRQMLDLLAMIIFGVCAVAGAVAQPLVALMFGPHWAAAAPVFAILTLVAPASALYSMINPLLAAVGHTRMVSRYAWWNAGAMAAAAWFGAPFGTLVLAWALAASGTVAVVLFLRALRQGLERSALPFLRLLLVPALALAVARLGAHVALAACPGLGVLTQLALGVGVATLCYTAVALLLARRRVLAMSLRLSRALLGRRESLQP